MFVCLSVHKYAKCGGEEESIYLLPVKKVLTYPFWAVFDLDNRPQQ